MGTPLKTIVLLGADANSEILPAVNFSTVTVYSTADYSGVEGGSKVTTLPSIPTFTTADGGGDGYLLPTVTKDGDNTTYTFDITDGAWTSFSNANDFSSASTDGTTTAIPVTLDYTRTFPKKDDGAEGWYSWFMPFQFTLTDGLLKQANFYYPAALVYDTQVVTSESNWLIYVVKKESGQTLYGNQTYFVKPAVADGETPTVFNITGATFMATRKNDPAPFNNVTHTATLIGNYDNTNFEAGWWTLWGNGTGFVEVSEEDVEEYNPRVSPMRFYMTLTKNDTKFSPRPSAASGDVAKPRLIRIVAFDDEATAIQSINKAVEQGHGKVYDLQGRPVTKPTHGLYIVDGRKVLVK